MNIISGPAARAKKSAPDPAQFKKAFDLCVRKTEVGGLGGGRELF
jgi:hypothetical protein